MSTKKVLTNSQSFDFESLPVPASDANARGRGSEGVTITDVTIPRLEIIQSLSPQRKKNDPSYINGSEEGLIFNTISHKLYGASVYVIPVFWRKEYVCWRDRLKGGGFCGAFQSFAEAEDAVASREDAHDIQILDTAQNFVLVADPDGSTEEAVISMAKSKMSVSRQWNSLVRMAGGDRFARVYKLETVITKGAKGEYFNWKVTQLGATPDALFKQAEAMYEAVSAGVRDVARDDEGE